MPGSKPPTGPKGGKTVVTAGGLLKKTLYFDKLEWAALRRKAFEEERSVSEIVRDLVRENLDLDE